MPLVWVSISTALGTHFGCQTLGILSREACEIGRGGLYYRNVLFAQMAVVFYLPAQSPVARNPRSLPTMPSHTTSLRETGANKRLDRPKASPSMAHLNRKLAIGAPGVVYLQLHGRTNAEWEPCRRTNSGRRHLHQP